MHQTNGFLTFVRNDSIEWQHLTVFTNRYSCKMYLSIVICDENLYEQAKWFFLQQWRSDLIAKDRNSLIWAYLITKYLREHWKPNFMFIDWVYTYEELFFSTSHCDDFLMLAIDNKKVAVDIEVIHRRDASLLRNIKIPRSPYSKRENFYIQRCAKECLIKFLWLTSEEMKEMKIVKFDPHKHFSVEEWQFESMITLWFRWGEYRIHVDVRNGRVISIMKESTTSPTNKQNISQPPVPPPPPDNGQYLCSMERQWMFRPID